MADSTGPILAAGAITAANSVLGNGRPWTTAIPTGVATAVAAALLALLERASHPLAVGIAWIALITSLLVPPTSGQSSVNNLIKITGL